MFTFFHLLTTEAIKLRRSMVIRLVWILPLIFVFLDFWLVGRSVLSIQSLSKEEALLFTLLPLKAIGVLWVSYFHPLMLALLPALLFRPEHRYGLWKHLHALPVSRRGIFLSKGVVLLFLSAVTLGLIALGLWFEWSIIIRVNPLVSFPFPWREIGKVLAWLLLGSLPLLAFYLWIADRINSGAVPIVLGLIGILLNISLSGQEVDQSWRRDLIPWILPYACAQQAIERHEARQETHIAAVPFRNEIDLNRFAGTQEMRLPSGRKATSTTDIPSFYLVPPPPSPTWLLIAFSLSAGMMLVIVGVVDAVRNRY